MLLGVNMGYDRVRKIAYYTIAILGAMLLSYIFIRYVFLLILPFLIAAAIVFSIERPAVWLKEKLHLSMRLSRLCMTLLATLAFFGLVGLGVWWIAVELWEFISGEGGVRIEAAIEELTSGGIFGALGDKVGDAVYSLVISLIENLGSFLSSFLGAVPRAILFLVITVISSVYFALDLDVIRGFLARVLPDSVTRLLGRLKKGFFSAIVGYIRSYSLLMLFTFGVLLLGFFILGVEHFVLFAFVISLLDALPVIGVGTALIPWGAYLIITKNAPLGFAILILYLTHTVLRQLVEPKIVGKNLGVHPIITLVVLYIGYSLFGFFGILLVPVFTVLLEVILGKDNSAEVDEASSAE